MTTASTAAGTDPGATASGAPPGSVLAVLAHPDDETLLAGGLLARLRQLGTRVVVVTATRGERGEMIGAPQLEGTDAVAPVRQAELAAALHALGVTEHQWLDELADPPTTWTDSGMAWIGDGLAGPAPDAGPTALSVAEIGPQATALARIVRELRPALVVSDEPGGSYGHPDHVRTHAVVVAALDLLAAAGETVPAHAVVAVLRERWNAARDAVALAAAEHGAIEARGNALAPLPERAPSLVRDRVDVEIDVTQAAPRTLAALRAYRSQVQAASVPVLDRPGGADVALLAVRQAAIGWYALSNGVVQPILPTVGLVAVRGDLAPAVVDVVAAAPTVLAAPPRPGPGEAPAPASQPLYTPPSLGRVLGVLGLVGLGLVVGVLTTLVHRWQLLGLPVGLVLAILTVAVGGLLSRALARGAGLLGFGLGTVVAVQALAFVTGGGDVIVPGDARGLAWLLGSVLAVGVAAFLPERLVRRRRA